MMMGYSYAATVLATHFIEGPIPTKLKEYKQDKLSKHAKQTVEWMKKGIRCQRNLSCQ